PRPEDRFYPAGPLRPVGPPPHEWGGVCLRQAVEGSRHCVTRRPHRSRRAFTLIAESCSFVRSRRPDRTAALMAAIALTSWLGSPLPSSSMSLPAVSPITAAWGRDHFTPMPYMLSESLMITPLKPSCVRRRPITDGENSAGVLPAAKPAP